MSGTLNALISYGRLTPTATVNVFLLTGGYRNYIFTGSRTIKF